MKVTHDTYGSRYLVVSYYKHSKEIWTVLTDDISVFKNGSYLNDFVLRIIDTKNPHQNDEG